jgi:hypothetical protein
MLPQSSGSEKKSSNVRVNNTTMCFYFIGMKKVAVMSDPVSWVKVSNRRFEEIRHLHLQC